MLDVFIKEVYEYVDDLYKIELISVTEEKNDIFLIFDIIDDMEWTWSKSRWEIRCYDYIQSSKRLDLNYYYDINIFDNHLLMMDISEKRYELYFGAASPDVEKLIGMLYIKHKDFTKGFIPFGKYIYDGNPDGSFDYDIDLDLIKSRYGLFAFGPESVMRAYAEVFELHNMKPSLLPANLYYQELGQNNSYKILVFGKSYVIAKNFFEKRYINYMFANILS